jgi:hypothetical protein
MKKNKLSNLVHDQKNQAKKVMLLFQNAALSTGKIVAQKGAMPGRPI